MGGADVVPGVSGGTIAFITGIYQELIETIHNLNFGVFKSWKQDGFKAMWKHYNLNFLFVLFLGIATSLLSLAKLVTYLLKTEPVLVWSFFFGLIIASIIYIGKQINRWNIWTILAIVIGTAISYYITIAEPLSSPDSLWYLFFAGFVAIIAMILPGLSGAFILLLLGVYQTVIGAISNLLDGLMAGDFNIFGDAVLKLAVAGVGAIVGIKAFSKVLTWMFHHHKNRTLAVLTGFMIGALNKVWPYKEVLKTRLNHNGESVPFLEKSISPQNFNGDPQLLWAIVAALAGCFLILGFEWLANKKAVANA